MNSKKLRMFNLFKKEEESSVKPLKYCSPPNVGWLEYKLKSKEMDYLWRCIENKNEENNSKNDIDHGRNQGATGPKNCDGKYIEYY